MTIIFHGTAGSDPASTILRLRGLFYHLYSPVFTELYTGLYCTRCGLYCKEMCKHYTDITTFKLMSNMFTFSISKHSTSRNSQIINPHIKPVNITEVLAFLGEGHVWDNASDIFPLFENEFYFILISRTGNI